MIPCLHFPAIFCLFFLDKRIDIVSTTSIMTDESYKEILEKAKADYWKAKSELAEFRKKQDELERRLVRIREIVIATSRLLGEEFVEEDELGLTDAVRQAYKTSNIPMSTVGVEKRLAKLGYDLARYETEASAKASIHTVVSRLAANGEIRPAGRNPAGRQLYKWAAKE